MDLRARMVAVAAGLMALTACSPLPQAALVYSSRVSFGVTLKSSAAKKSYDQRLRSDSTGGNARAAVVGIPSRKSP